MANSFWNFVTRMVAGELARADDVNTNFDGVAAGFTLVETEIGKAIQITNGAGVTDITTNAATRANKLLEFDVNGDVAATTIMGDWKGDHADAAGTDYQIRDVVKDAAGALGQDNLYICIDTHTSTGDLLADTADWELLVDVEAVAASEAAAAASEAAAAASYDSFDDRYLGPKASAPTLDNDGQALITGAMYFNSTSDLMYIRTSGAAWELTTANAVNVNVTDAGGYLVAADVEAALQELWTGGHNFPSGTAMLFYQTAAPTGWTRDVTASMDDHALRVVTDGTWGSGTNGTTDFTTQFAQGFAGEDYTLLTADIPAHTHGSVGAHTHTVPRSTAGGNNPMTNSGSTTTTSTTTSAAGGHTHNSVGGNGAHAHDVNLGVKYLDVIIATKD